ncbi:MAG: hypothetical protein GXY76_03740 [Chloroflexi bacterium]|nr:hypothetical protein [Chloroflexota bacterium]
MAETCEIDRCVLEGVDHYRVVEPMFEGIRVVLDYREEPYSPAYIQGISGAAFRLAGICPCAPTCGCAMEPRDLISLLGYEFQYLPLSGEGRDPQQEIHNVIDRVRDSIRAGHPALVWHAFTNAEWDVVCGYDDVTGLFYGRGSYTGWEAYASAAQTRPATSGVIAPELGAILIGERDAAYEPREAEIAALREAVRHAHDRRNVDRCGGSDWVMLYGLACYDRWVREFAADPPKLPTMGDRYCFNVFRSTHRAGAAFLREIAPRYPEGQVALLHAATHLSGEADALDEAADVLFPGCQFPKEASHATSAQAAALLSNARERYARAVAEIEIALRGMGA